MARTVRRNDSKGKVFFKRYVQNMGHLRGSKYIQRTPEEMVKLFSADYHSDNHPGEWTLDSWTRKVLQTKFRAKNRQLLNQAIAHMEEMIEIPLKKGW